MFFQLQAIYDVSKDTHAAMAFFSKALLTGIGVLLLLAGTGETDPPVIPGRPDQEWFSSPSTFPFFRQPTPRPRPTTFNTPPEHVSIANLLNKGTNYHQHLVAVRGLVTQPELHLDESKMFFDFVFRLEDGNQSLVVFGRHDRTQGAPSISLGLSVEVIGVFWKQRLLNESPITNAIEALAVVPYPSLIPESA
jgi:hypothetical protein